MTVALASADFQRLVRIIQNLPEFGSARDRRRLVANTLAGSNRADTILSRIDFDGTPMGVATEVVRFLATFGQVSPGYEALGLFLDQLLMNMGVGDDADFLAGLLTRYPLRPPAPTAIVNASPAKIGNASAQYVFISYARPDAIIAEQVEQFLKAAGFRLFRDTEAIHTGANWDMTIEQALNDATHMVLLVSASSMPYRKEVYREWFFFEQKRKPIFPLYIQDCTLHSRLLAVNYIDARNDLTGALQQLAQDLIKP